MEQKILEKIQKWDSFENLEKTLREELNELKKDEKALYDAFYTDIAFGTGGLRGVLGVGTNRMNIYVVAKTTKGFVNYMIKKYPRVNEMGVVISYDCRKNSDVFSKVAANVIAASGIKVYIFESLRKTVLCVHLQKSNLIHLKFERLWDLKQACHLEQTLYHLYPQPFDLW